MTGRDDGAVADGDVADGDVADGDVARWKKEVGR
jgi:hypothetical protein